MPTTDRPATQNYWFPGRPCLIVRADNLFTTYPFHKYHGPSLRCYHMIRAHCIVMNSVAVDNSIKPSILSYGAWTYAATSGP